MNCITALMAIITFFSQEAAVALSDEADDVGCAESSLFIMLKLNGSDCQLQDVLSAFGEGNKKGRSMDQILTVARRFGLKLRGMQLHQSLSLDRPAIVFLKQPSDIGHFIVLKPISPAGKSVQVISDESPPHIVEYSRVTSDPRWTGLALVPLSYYEEFLIFLKLRAFALFLLISFLSIIVVGTRKRRSPKPCMPD